MSAQGFEKKNGEHSGISGQEASLLVHTVRLRCGPAIDWAFTKQLQPVPVFASFPRRLPKRSLHRHRRQHHQICQHRRRWWWRRRPALHRAAAEAATRATLTALALPAAAAVAAAFTAAITAAMALATTFA